MTEPRFDVTTIGDAMAAGIIHGWLAGDFALGLRFGAALAALALRRHGDVVTCRPVELTQLLATSTGHPLR